MAEGAADVEVPETTDELDLKQPPASDASPTSLTWLRGVSYFLGAHRLKDGATPSTGADSGSWSDANGNRAESPTTQSMGSRTKGVMVPYQGRSPHSNESRKEAAERRAKFERRLAVSSRPMPSNPVASEVVAAASVARTIAAQPLWRQRVRSPLDTRSLHTLRQVDPLWHLGRTGQRPRQRSRLAEDSPRGTDVPPFASPFLRAASVR